MNVCHCFRPVCRSNATNEPRNEQHGYALLTASTSSAEEIGTKTCAPETTGEPVAYAAGCSSRKSLFHKLSPVCASKARTLGLSPPMNAAQPLGEIDERRTTGVVRVDALSTAQ